MGSCSKACSLAPRIEARGVALGRDGGGEGEEKESREEKRKRERARAYLLT